ncbi:uncharacterized protein ACIB01_014666 [Guaruba guarouba]
MAQPCTNVCSSGLCPTHALLGHTASPTTGTRCPQHRQEQCWLSPIPVPVARGTKCTGWIKENYSHARRHEPHARPCHQPGHSTATVQRQSTPILQADGSDLLPALWGAGSPQHGLPNTTKALPAPSSVPVPSAPIPIAVPVPHQQDTADEMWTPDFSRSQLFFSVAQNTHNPGFYLTLLHLLIRGLLQPEDTENKDISRNLSRWNKKMKQEPECCCCSPGSFTGVIQPPTSPEQWGGTPQQSRTWGEGAGALLLWVPGLGSCSADGSIGHAPREPHCSQTHPAPEPGGFLWSPRPPVRSRAPEQRGAGPGCAAITVFISNQHEPGELPARGWSLAARGAPLMRIIGSPPAPPRALIEADGTVKTMSLPNRFDLCVGKRSIWSFFLIPPWDGGRGDPGTVWGMLVRLQSPTEAAWSRGPEHRSSRHSAEARPWPGEQQGWEEATGTPHLHRPQQPLSIPSASSAVPGLKSKKQNGFLVGGAGEAGISHLLNELIRAQRFHFEEAAGLSSISVVLEPRGSGGDGAISNTCSPGGLHGGEAVGFNGRRPRHGSPKAGFKMNGANCSSSCHISRADTKPLLTHKQ